MRRFLATLPFVVLCLTIALSMDPGASASGAAARFVTVALTTDFPTLHASIINDTTVQGQILPNVYETLFARDQKGQLFPLLAESYKLLGLNTWDITLRKGVRFHNGEPFDSGSVKYTLEFILNPANRSQLQTFIDAIARVEATDQFRVRIVTKTPTPMLLANLSVIPMVPPKLASERGPDYLNTHAVGTGPFRFVSWTRGQEVVLEADPNYRRGKPVVDRLILRPIPDASVRVAALLAGEVQIAFGVPPHVAAQIQQAGYRLRSVPGNRVIFLGFDTINAGPLQIRAVRQAINHAVDVDLLIKQVLGGHATRMPGPLPTINPDSNKEIKPYAYDPNLTKKLLAEAGFSSGIKVAMYAPSGRYINDKEVAEAIASQLKRANIEPDLQVMEWGTYLSMVRANRPPGIGIYLLGRQDFLYDASILLFWFKTGATFVTYSNPNLDRTMTLAASIMDPVRRRQAFVGIQKTIWEEAPWLFLYSQNDIYGIARNLLWEPRSDERFHGFDIR